VSATFGIDPVKPEHVAAVWPEVAPLFKRALKRSDSWDTMASLRADVDKGNTTLWLICDSTSMVAAFITGVVAAARGRLLNAVILGGSRMSEWFVQFEQKLRDIAKAEDCKAVVAVGRRGWKRIFERCGWADGPTTMLRMI
jgi:hypothetical protein